LKEIATGQDLSLRIVVGLLFQELDKDMAFGI
jgi:hypothetical protein